MNKEYERGMKAFHTSHGGAMQICIVRREDAPFLLQEALEGDMEYRVILESITNWMRAADRRKKNERFLCLDCNVDFHRHERPDAFLIVTPFAAKTTHAMVTGICQRCAARDNAALSTAALSNLRVIYPDATFAKSGQG